MGIVFLHTLPYYIKPNHHSFTYYLAISLLLLDHNLKTRGQAPFQVNAAGSRPGWSLLVESLDSYHLFWEMQGQWPWAGVGLPLNYSINSGGFIPWVDCGGTAMLVGTHAVLVSVTPSGILAPNGKGEACEGLWAPSPDGDGTDSGSQNLLHFLVSARAPQRSVWSCSTRNGGDKHLPSVTVHRSMVTSSIPPSPHECAILSTGCSEEKNDGFALPERRKASTLGWCSVLQKAKTPRWCWDNGTPVLTRRGESEWNGVFLWNSLPRVFYIGNGVSWIPCVPGPTTGTRTGNFVTDPTMLMPETSVQYSCFPQKCSSPHGVMRWDLQSEFGRGLSEHACLLIRPLVFKTF